MLIKHNLDLYSIQSEGKPEETEHQAFFPDEISTKTEGDWVRLLAQVIAEFNMCQVIGTGKARGRIYIIGKPTNVELCWYIVEQLVNRIRPMAKDAFKEYNGFEKRNTFIRGFLMGAIAGIRKQLAEKAAKEAWQASQDKKDNLIGTTALMTVNMLAKHKMDNEAYIKAQFNTTSARVRTTASTGGRAIGKEKGYGMSIHSGLGKSNSSGPKGLLN